MLKWMQELQLTPEEKADGILRGPRPYPHPYLEIPEGISAIDAAVFKGNGDITTIVLPSSLRQIGKQAFAGCANVLTVLGGTGVEHIADEAFSGCTGLSEALLPGRLRTLGTRAYAGCRALTAAKLPASVETLGRQCFYRCTGIGMPALPEHLARADKTVAELFGIPDGNGFLRDGSILDSYHGHARKITVPDGITQIRAGAFDISPVPVEGLEIRLPAGLRKLERSAAFLDPGVRLNLPEGYLRQARQLPETATADLIAGAWRNQILAADIVSLYLFQNRALLSKAAELLEERDPGQMLRLMERRLQDENLAAARRRRGLARMAEFCYAHADQLPAGWRHEFFPSEQPPEVLVLEAAGLDPADTLLGQVPARNREGTAEPEHIRTALAAYLAVGLHCERTGRPAFLVAAGERAAAEADAEALQVLAGSYLPGGRDGSDMVQAYAFLRFCSGTQARPYLTGLLKMPQAGRRARTSEPDAGLLRPLMLNDTGETQLAMVRAETAFPDRGILHSYLQTHIPQQEHRPLCFPAPLGLDKAGSKTYLDAEQLPLLGISFAEDDEGGHFEMRDLRTGRRRKSLPVIPDAEWRVRISQDIADVQAYYADLVAWIRREQLDSFLLGRSMHPVMWQQVYGDPFLRCEGTGIVFEQDGRTFVWDGQYPRSSQGRRLRLAGEAPICVAHPVSMSAKDLARWKAWFAARPASGRFSQLSEPVYTSSEIRPDRYDGCTIASWDLQKAEPQLQFEQSLRRRRNALAIGAHGSLRADMPASTAGSAQLVLGELRLGEIDRAANHALYLLDLWTLEQRIARDDISALKVLETVPRPELAPYLDLAVASGAAQLTAALLEYTQAALPAADDEFTLDG